MSYQINYSIEIPEKSIVREYLIELDERSAHLKTANAQVKPDWAKLSFEKCGVCSLKDKDHPFCPVALNLANLVEDFKDMLSYTEAVVTVKTPERVYVKQTDLQSALQSIFGVVMATSGCPVLDYFRPMARFHLPFSSVEDHMVRSVGFHLIRLLFRQQKGENVKISLDGLVDQYRKVSGMNVDFSKRIAAAAKKDADRNAIVGLHALSEIIGSEISTDLASIETFFE